MLSSRLGAGLCATLARASRTYAPLSGLSVARLSPVALPALTLTTTRQFAIPAKPKKGSSAESGPRRPRSKKSGVAASKPRTKRLTPEEKAAKKEAEREKKLAQKQRDTVRKQREREVQKQQERKARKAERIRALSPEALARKQVRDERAALKALKDTALSPPSTYGRSAWIQFQQEQIRTRVDSTSRIEDLGNLMKVIGHEFANLSHHERENYAREATAANAARATEHKQYVHSHTVEQIRKANVARRKLAAMQRAKGAKVVTKWAPIEDDRVPPQPLNAFFRFSNERRAEPEYRAMGLEESALAIGKKWHELSEEAKKPYRDAYLQERAKWMTAYADVTGLEPRLAPEKSA